MCAHNRWAASSRDAGLHHSIQPGNLTFQTSFLTRFFCSPVKCRITAGVHSGDELSGWQLVKHSADGRRSCDLISSDLGSEQKHVNQTRPEVDSLNISHHLLLAQNFILNSRLGASANPFLRRPFPFLPDWLHGLSDHAQRLYGCVRLSRPLVGFWTHFKSPHFHSFI